MFRKVKATIYGTLGAMLAWSWVQQGHYGLALTITLFTATAVGLTLSAFGKTRIDWDDSGITVRSAPAKPKHHPWSSIEKLKVDHLGYHILTRHGRVRISRRNMPDSLRDRVRSAIRENSDGALDSRANVR